MPGFFPMSGGISRSTRPSDRQPSDVSHRPMRQRIFNELDPAFRSLRNKSRALSADEASCQELKESVKRYDALLLMHVNQDNATDEEDITNIRQARAKALEEIRESRQRRSGLIIELSQAQQAWEMVYDPSDEELDLLTVILEQDFAEFWEETESERPPIKGKAPMYPRGSKVPADPPASPESSSDPEDITDQAGPSSGSRVPSTKGKSKETQAANTKISRPPSIRSLDIASLTITGSKESPTVSTQIPTNPVASGALGPTNPVVLGASTPTNPVASGALRPTNPAGPTSPRNIGSENAASPLVSFESMVDRVHEKMRASKDHLSNALRNIGNLGQRRRKSE